MRTILLLSSFCWEWVPMRRRLSTGTVSDQNGDPVPGANIVIVGKAIGTTTDFDGNFNLETSEVPPFQLRITSIGYSRGTGRGYGNNQTFRLQFLKRKPY